VGALARGGREVGEHALPTLAVAHRDLQSEAFAQHCRLRRRRVLFGPRREPLQRVGQLLRFYGADPPTDSRLGLVPRLDPLRAVEVELVGVRAALREHRLEQERVVVARVHALEHAADEASSSARIPTRYVRFLCERQTAKREGSMLVWVAKPTRQPERSSSAQAVTISIG